MVLLREFEVRLSNFGFVRLEFGDAEDRERVLEAFQRGTPRGLETVKGLGIGLTLARLQADAMGASLDLNAGPGCWWTLRLRAA